MKLCAYLRVSTSQQKESQTIENQRMLLDSFVKFNKDLRIVEWFVDDGVSAFAKRPNFDNMMQRISEFDGIIISKLSRIGRSTSQLLKIVEDLRRENKQLIVIGDNIDTTTPQGRLFFTILAAFNEYESSLIRERMEEGLARYKANGGKVGRRTKPLRDVEGETPSQKKLKALYEQGLGLKTLSKMFNASKETIKQRLIEIGVKIRKPKGFETL